MRTAIITITDKGQETAKTLCQELKADIIPRKSVGEHWQHYDAFVFVGALGICVRTIAPYITDKHSDPAVTCIDSQGRHAISVLSGHVGGANDLTKIVAATMGARPVITTQSDNSGIWPLDTLCQRFGWSTIVTTPSGRRTDDMNGAIFAFVGKKPTALLLDIRDRGTDMMEETLPPHVKLVTSISDITPNQHTVAIIVSPRKYTAPTGIWTIQYVPKVLTIGIGLAHQAQPAGAILDNIHDMIEEHGMVAEAIHDYATIDVKSDEPVVKLLQQQGKEVIFFTTAQLSGIEVPTPSDTVARHVGTHSVSEAAAILATDHGRLLVTKQKGKDKTFTLAVAIARNHLREGHVEIVGAGPGDPDLISVRGRRQLEKADLILYAGSLVPRELTLCARPGAVVRSSAAMTLEEQCTLIKDFYDRGKYIVRLHTGDPCIFGAIQEQMAFFDRHGMSYHITPGISSFLAAAAELQSQFTIPGKTQTIILTRGEGRTPMPEREKLHLLARSQSTMCIFLSAAIADDVQRELLQEYPASTPVAVCYHLTWKDQRIYRGVLGDLSKIIHDNHLTLTTMIVVGEAIDNRKGLSELYSKHFTHLFRKGEE